MHEARVLEEMSEDEVLDFADACAQTAWRAEVDLLRAAYQWGVLHSADRLDPAESWLPGRERARQLGGPGVPEVTEFAAAEFGARIGRSPDAAARLIADAQDLYVRHPQLWARVQAGEVRASYARHVVSKTRDLQPEEAAYVDAGVVESADGPMTRRHHRIKTHAGWQVRQPFPGSTSGATPTAATTSSTTPAPADSAARPPTPDGPTPDGPTPAADHRPSSTTTHPSPSRSTTTTPTPPDRYGCRRAAARPQPTVIRRVAAE